MFRNREIMFKCKKLDNFILIIYFPSYEIDFLNILCNVIILATSLKKNISKTLRFFLNILFTYLKLFENETICLVLISLSVLDYLLHNNNNNSVVSIRYAYCLLFSFLINCLEITILFSFLIYFTDVCMTMLKS